MVGGEIRRYAALGALGSALLGAGGWSAGALTLGERDGVWGVPAPSLVLLGAVAAYAGLSLLVVAWWQLGALLRDGGAVSRRQQWVVLGCWAAPMVPGPLLFSSDAYSYVAQGAVAHRGWDAYEVGPAALGGVLPGDVPGMWRGTPAPYGPLWVAVCEAVVAVTGEHHVVVAVWGLRLLGLAALGLLAWAVRWLAGATGAGQAGAWWAAPLNPLLLVHVVGGVHNEALMLGLLLAGLVLFRRGYWRAGTAVLTLAALVKAPVGVALLCAGAAAVAARPGGRPRVRRALAIAAVAGGTLLAGVAACGQGWGWLHTVSTPARVVTLLSPTTAVGWVSGAALAGLGWGTQTAALTVVRGVGLLAGAGVVVFWVRRAPRVGVEYAVGMALLGLVVSAPVVQPWYLLWGVVPLAAVAWPLLARTWVKAATVVMVLVTLPSGQNPERAYLLAAVTGVLLVAAVCAARAWRAGRMCVPTAAARAPR
ncbi:polyprenol phosphomannose-dependent alpha 1,6 mannosyltransferase MptB [Streptomyces sp. NPDC057743]|uniref:polyprenol phosphomannose-dependent alpha 1,6 mannosyltransferase MptB n=1 Tax=Streptomyces sp. NPDC057743 TaxID=3346236 RepID=UPI00368F3E20